MNTRSVSNIMKYFLIVAIASMSIKGMAQMPAVLNICLMACEWKRIWWMVGWNMGADMTSMMKSRIVL